MSILLVAPAPVSTLSITVVKTQSCRLHHEQMPGKWKLGPPASSSSAPASIVSQTCATMVSVPTQGASRAVIQAVCNVRVVRCAAPSMSNALQRDLSRLVQQQPVRLAKPSQSIQRSRRGLITTAAEGNGAGPASTGLSIDLRGDAMRSLTAFAGCAGLCMFIFKLSALVCRQEGLHRWSC